MTKTFKEARKAAPAIVFIDEVDSFPNRATIRHHYREWETQVVNALLAEIDVVDGRDGVVLVAACNDPYRLDPALIRAGRLDRHIRMQMPDRRALALILREHLCGELADTNLEDAALAALGSSGADIEKFVRGASRRSRDAGRPLRLDDLLVEIGGIDDRTASELYVSACHEGGHALALCDLLHLPGSLQAVTLRPSGARAGGATMGGDIKAFMSRRDIQHRLIAILAGRAAEEAIVGLPSSSAGGSDDSDLAQATRLAAGAAVSLGLDETVGLLWSGELDPGRNLFRIFGEQPALADRVRAVVDEAYAEALTFARQRSSAIRELADRLIDKRVLDGTEVEAIAAECPADVACGGVP